MNELGCNYEGIEFDKNPSAECMDILDEISTNIEWLNIYNLYGECYGGANATEEFLDDLDSYRPENKFLNDQDNSAELRVKSPKKRGFTARDYTPWAFSNRAKRGLVRSTADEVEGADLGPCTFGIPLMDFLDDPEVRNQLHIPEKVQNWTMCRPNYNYTMYENATQSIWDNENLYSKYKMLKFSGDKDGSVPTYGSLGWIESLGRETVNPWRTWYVNREGKSSLLGGMTWELKGLTFVTVHGAGHMVPQDQREAALVMLNSFLAGDSMPKRNDTMVA
jgi:hypothetical protein